MPDNIGSNDTQSNLTETPGLSVSGAQHHHGRRAKSTVAGNLLLVLGALICLFGFYGVAKYAMGFLFPQPAAFLLLLIIFILIYALVVTAGIGLIVIAQRLNEGHSFPHVISFFVRVGMPIALAIALRLLIQVAFVPNGS